MWGLFTYREIVPQEKLVFVNSFSDEKGGITRHPGSADLAAEYALDLHLRGRARRQNQVHRDLAHARRHDEEQKTFDAMHDSMTQGWGGTMDQLAAYLAKTK